MKVVFHTNLDYPKQGWPNELPCLPNVGDFIRNQNKSPKGYDVDLKVVRIVWIQQRFRRQDFLDYEYVYTPHIELHIGDQFPSIEKYQEVHGY